MAHVDDFSAAAWPAAPLPSSQATPTATPRHVGRNIHISVEKNSMKNRDSTQILPTRQILCLKISKRARVASELCMHLGQAEVVYVYEYFICVQWNALIAIPAEGE